jgi:micrococcal nuclease
MRKTILAFILLLCSALVLYADLENATVIQVVDVDTLRVEYQGLEESLRLIGIAAPDSSAEDEDLDSQDSDSADRPEQKATEFVQTLVHPGEKISLEFDVEPRDRNNRLLAYVYLSDTTMLNYTIIQKGFAVPVTVPPNVKYASQFSWAYRDAKTNHFGLWQEK